MPDRSSDQRSFLSTELASPRRIRMALIAIAISTIFFAAAAPFARVQLGPAPAFVPIYVATLVICDLITAVLLLGQFSIMRSRALLVLACGYVFTAAMTSSYVLMFPGLFSPEGLLGAGPQSTSAMYIFWHGGFPLVVIAYALIREPGKPTERAGAPKPAGPRAAAIGIATVLATVVGYTVLVTSGDAILPVFIEGNRTTDLGHIVLSCDWILSLIALLVLWRRRTHTVLDLWLMVVMCVWLFDLALAAILNTGRYDLGWYVGRIYGLLAASALLVMLLIENGKHYSQLIRMTARLADANDELEQLSLHDPLTELANRRYFDTYLAGQVGVARRYHRPLSFVLFDVDCFKAYNDHYGHQAGDAVLRRVAAVLRSCCRRPADLAARYGGEEFAMILPDTELAGATAIAETARKTIEQMVIPHGKTLIALQCVSISGGIAILSDATTPEDLIRAADRALFQAKALGRNRTVFAPSTGPEPERTAHVPEPTYEHEAPGPVAGRFAAAS